MACLAYRWVSYLRLHRSAVLPKLKFSFVTSKYLNLKTVCGAIKSFRMRKRERERENFPPTLTLRALSVRAFVQRKRLPIKLVLFCKSTESTTLFFIVVFFARTPVRATPHFSAISRQRNLTTPANNAQLRSVAPRLRLSFLAAFTS